jgi:hypothetical protein
MTTDLEILRADLAAARLPRPRTRLALLVVAAALTISAAALAANHYIGQPAPERVQTDIHRTAVLLFTGSPGLAKDTARVVAESRDATLYGISDLKGNYCVELVGAHAGLVWSFSCDLGLRVGGTYATSGATGSDQVASVVVDGVEPPVVQWGRLTSGTVGARAAYPDGTTEEIPIGSNGFFVYEPSDENQARARRLPMTIEFLRKDGSAALSTQVLPPQPLAVTGHPGGGSGTVAGRVAIDGATAIEVDEWGKGRRPGTHFVALNPDGTFSITWQRGQPSLMYVVDRNHNQLTDFLQPLPESVWRPIVEQARG